MLILNWLQILLQSIFDVAKIDFFLRNKREKGDFFQTKYELPYRPKNQQIKFIINN